MARANPTLAAAMTEALRENTVIIEVPIENITVDPDARYIRQKEVEAIAAEIMAGRDFSTSHPLDILEKHVDGQIEYHLLNGHHRLEAAILAEKATWTCVIHRYLTFFLHLETYLPTKSKL